VPRSERTPRKPVNKVKTAREFVDNCKEAQMQGQCDTKIKPFNQVDSLTEEVERLDRLIKDQEAELLYLYRRVNGIY